MWKGFKRRKGGGQQPGCLSSETGQIHNGGDSATTVFLEVSAYKADYALAASNIEWLNLVSRSQ